MDTITFWKRPVTVCADMYGCVWLSACACSANMTHCLWTQTPANEYSIQYMCMCVYLPLYLCLCLQLCLKHSRYWIAKRNLALSLVEFTVSRDQERKWSYAYGHPPGWSSLSRLWECCSSDCWHFGEPFGYLLDDLDRHWPALSSYSSWGTVIDM